MKINLKKKECKTCRFGWGCGSCMLWITWSSVPDLQWWRRYGCGFAWTTSFQRPPCLLVMRNEYMMKKEHVRHRHLLNDSKLTTHFFFFKKKKERKKKNVEVKNISQFRVWLLFKHWFIYIYFVSIEKLALWKILLLVPVKKISSIK